MNKRIILCGPSCAGKNYIRDKFVNKGYKADVSYTSRTPREGEVNDVDYKFISEEYFKEMIMNNLFYEWVKYGDNYYGTGKFEWEHSDIFIMETDGISKILPIHRGECLVMYINTPLEVRAQRMKSRGWDQAKLEERIEVDIKKFKNFKDYDLEISSEVSNEHWFLENNDDIDKCTCHRCLSNKSCEYSYDGYNTDGDCLVIK